MIDAVAGVLAELLANDPSVILLGADSGPPKLNRLFNDKQIQRATNVGISEANMMGSALGLAETGFRPITVALASFLLRWGMPQLSAPRRGGVVAIGNASGLSLSNLGPSHCELSDLALARAAGFDRIAAPASGDEAGAILLEYVGQSGLSYIRLESETPADWENDIPFAGPGPSGLAVDGKDAFIISMGTCFAPCMRAREILGNEGLDVGVGKMQTLRPLNDDLLSIAAKTGTVMTVEEHGWGGLGTVVAERLASRFRRVRFRAVRPNALPPAIHGPRDRVLEELGLAAESIAGQLREEVS